MAVLLGVVAEARWGLLSRLVPRQRRLCVPWSGAEVFLAVVLYYIWPSVIAASLDMRGFSTGSDGLDAFLSYTLAVPFWVASVLLLFGAGSDTRPYQLGLHGHRLGANVLLGVIAWLAATPLVYLIHQLTMWTLDTKDEHPLQRIARTPHLGAAVLVILSAVVAAPLAEELLFRGVLQPWLARRRWGGALAVGLALLVAYIGAWSSAQSDLGESSRAYREDEGRPVVESGVLERQGQEVVLIPDDGSGPRTFRFVPDYSPRLLERYVGRHVRITGKEGLSWVIPGRLVVLDRDELAELTPALFVLLVAPMVWVVPPLVRRWLPDVNATCAILGTALLFSAVHPVWPSPVPLLALAVVLGFLAYRTQSLVPSLVLHALFNAVACFLVFLFNP